MARNTQKQAATLRRDLPAGVLLFYLALCVGCGERNAYIAPPPPDVVVGVAEQRSITTYHEYTGTTQASKSVDIKARVQGYLESIHFEDGADVAEGDLLFVIDQRPYKAALDQAKADLEGKKAAAAEQLAVYNRDLTLLPSKAITQEDIDIQHGNLLVAEAAVTQSQAAREAAQLNLDYTKIAAPIGGRISRRLVDVGNLISANTTLLTTITRYDPMYAYFNPSETNYLDYLKRRREGSIKFSKPPAAAGGEAKKGTQSAVAAEHVPVEMGLANESGYPHKGFIDFADNTVDPTTGTILVRGVFPNPQPYFLAPGLFVRIRIPVGTDRSAILAPDRALGTDQAGRYLLIVKSDHTVEHRAVQAGSLVGDMRVIDKGLEAGEQMIVEGLQRARPGIKVNPIRPTSEKRSGDENSKK